MTCFIHNAPASNIRRSWEESRAQFPKAALHMRISDDHDETRAVTRYGLNGALAASALMFTLDGVPLIYNGMEAGDTNQSSGGALFDKRDILWQAERTPAVAPHLPRPDSTPPSIRRAPQFARGLAA
jgi:cyclomaltodextrinase